MYIHPNRAFDPQIDPPSLYHFQWAHTIWYHLVGKIEPLIVFGDNLHFTTGHNSLYFILTGANIVISLYDVSAVYRAIKEEVPI